MCGRDHKLGHSANEVTYECPSRELRKGKKDALVTRREFLEPAIATTRRFWLMQSLAKDRGCCSFTSGTPYSVCIG